MDSVSDTWGYAPRELYLARWALIQPNLPVQRFTVIDWGSDSGWFSVKIAKEFPQSTVVSVESGTMSDGDGLKLHRRKQSEYLVSETNLIAETCFGPDTFPHLKIHASGLSTALSVFHHMGDGFGRYLRGRRDWNQVFCDLIRCARVTFQLPNEDSPSETPHRARNWYDGRSLAEVIEDALDSEHMNAEVSLIGQTQHGSKGMRQMYMIRADEVVPSGGGSRSQTISAAGANIRLSPAAD